LVTSASSRGTGASICRRMTMSSRSGCCWAALAAASSAAWTSVSSTTTTSVSAQPEVTDPPLRRSAASALTTAVPVVSHSVVTGSSSPCRPPQFWPPPFWPPPAGRRPVPGSWPPPGPAVAGQHLVGLLRAPLAGPVRVRRGGRPVLLQRVDHLPGRLHLVVAGEQRRVAEQHVQDQPLVRLRAGLGELLAVQEVHRHVADLHAGPRHLGTELQRDALVRLHPDDELVVPQLLGVGGGERQV